MAGTLFAAYPKRYKPRPKIRHQETDLQIKVAGYIRKNYPDVIFISSGNGLDKTVAQAGIWKAINSDDKHPDILIIHRSRGYAGLAIEIKKEGERVYKRDGTIRRQMVAIRNKRGVKIGEYNHLELQEACLKKFIEQGWFARFGIGFDKITQLIDWFMNRPQTLELF